MWDEFVDDCTGVIGTGLFLGTATALQHGGPVGLLLGYGIMGTICYAVMVWVSHVVWFFSLTAVC